MTLREAMMVIEASIWRDRQQMKQALGVAWHVAAFSRAKRLPTLKRVLSSTKASTKARPLKGAELARRRDEFENMTAAVDVEALAQRLKRKIPRQTSE